MTIFSAAESLRDWSSATRPDPRMQPPSESLEQEFFDHRRRVIAEWVLGDEVLEDVQIHYETAKNALLYAWFVYRFHMVAEQYVLSTLELALRERLQQLRIIKIDPNNLPGLKRLIRLAAERGLLTNASFTPGAAEIRARAEERHSLEIIQMMAERGLKEYEYDPATIEIKPEDELDWIAHFTSSIPDLRNRHGHGSSMLYPNVARTFVIVRNLIDQVWTNVPVHQAAVKKR